MRPRTARFDRAIAGSHQMQTTVDVFYGGSLVASGLHVVDGTYDADRTKAVLASVDLVLAEPDLVPQSAGPLTPYGYEMRVRRGVVYGDGTTDLLDLGLFPIQQSSFAGGNLSATIRANDRSQLVIDADLEDDYLIADGTNYGDAIKQLILNGVPSATFSFPTTAFATPAIVVPMGTDRWEQAQKMATACGWELYVNSSGAYAARPEPSIANTSSSLTIAEGGVLIDLGLDLDRGPAYNRVIYSGERTDAGAVYTGSAIDNDPTSLTYYYGGFGRKQMPVQRSPLLTSDLQCTVAAQGMLDRVKGVARSLRAVTTVNPALEAGDAITLTRGALGVNSEVHIVDAVRFGLGPSADMTISSRQVR